MSKETHYVQLWLTCKDKTEADKISSLLLKKQFVACAKQVPVSSDFRWKNEVEHADEVLVIFDTRSDLFDRIEKEITTLHSYETFVLYATPLHHISRSAQVWLEGSLIQSA